MTALFTKSLWLGFQRCRFGSSPLAFGSSTHAGIQLVSKRFVTIKMPPLLVGKSRVVYAVEIQPSESRQSAFVTSVPAAFSMGWMIVVISSRSHPASAALR